MRHNNLQRYFAFIYWIFYAIFILVDFTLFTYNFILTYFLTIFTAVLKAHRIEILLFLIIRSPFLRIHLHSHLLSAQIGNRIYHIIVHPHFWIHLLTGNIIVHFYICIFSFCPYFPIPFHLTSSFHFIMNRGTFCNIPGFSFSAFFLSFAFSAGRFFFLPAADKQKWCNQKYQKKLNVY